MGQEWYQSGVLLKEEMVLADCRSNFCMKQEVISNDLTTVHLMCDRATGIDECNPEVVCQKDGTYIYGGPNIYCISTCCSRDYCNRSRNTGASLHYVIVLLVPLLYSFLPLLE